MKSVRGRKAGGSAAVPPQITASVPSQIIRGTVVEMLDSGEIMLRCPSVKGGSMRCDLLESADTAWQKLQPGDPVLVLAPASPDENGCVLGRIGRYKPATAPPTDHLVIEAGETLTLKCGESSVDLRKDGKLMIRGNDVLTRARRTQRIKGGTVAIN